MDWLNHRQTLIAQNVANADTPNYLPSDLKEVDFGTLMGRTNNKPTIHKVTTDEQHIGRGETVASGKSQGQRTVYEEAPSDNAVDLEEQLYKAQQTASDYQMMVNLYRKNINMVKIAIGKA